MELYYQKGIDEGIHWLDKDESRHAIKVLRHNAGDEIQLTDGLGNHFIAKITKANALKCEFNVLSKTSINPPPYSIHIAIAPTKNFERLEWFVEKATELGIQQISILLTQHSERHKLKLDRLYKKAISAMKQSKQFFLPVIELHGNFNSFISNTDANEKFIASVDQENPYILHQKAKPGKSYLVLIGPEGDFSQNEIDKALTEGFSKVSLGKNVLRTETAGIAACHMLNLINS